jgi:sugar phosphate isomerase/epimerase
MAADHKINCSVACLHLMDHRFLLDELNYINCPGFEFMIYSVWMEHYREVARELKAGGFQFNSMHGPKQTGRLLSEADPESHNQAQKLLRDSIDTTRELGASVLTIHLWDQNSTDPKLERNLDSLYKLRDYAIDRGVSVSVEFIPHTHCRISLSQHGPGLQLHAGS